MPSQRAVKQNERLDRIKAIHSETRGVYGARRLRRELQLQGIKATRKTVIKLMKVAKIATHRKRRFRKTTDSDHDRPVSPNLIQRNFCSDYANECWVSDITYIRTDEGWLYLCSFLDLYSRKVVGWSMSDSLDTGLVVSAFHMACKRRGRGPAIVHSDRGSQYASVEFRTELAKYPGCRQSMSRRANCFDNAVAESFFATLKMELVHPSHFASKEKARTAVFEYVEVFYNQRRLHSYLNYVSPAQFESQPKTA